MMLAENEAASDGFNFLFHTLLISVKKMMADLQLPWATLDSLEK